MTSCSERIEIIARGLISDSGHVLLCRAPAGYLYLPGGHVEPGETAREALARELAEEAGVVVRPGRLHQVHECRFVQGGCMRHEINLVFHVEHELRSTATVASREVDLAFVWMPIIDAGQADVRPRAALTAIESIVCDDGRVMHLVD